MLKFLLELVYVCSFEFVVHLVNGGGDLSWWSNEWSLFCFQRAHVISGLRHVWSFIALTVMWIVDIYHIYPSLANTKTFLPQQRTKREQYLTLVSKPNTLKTCVTTGMGLISKCSCHWCEGLLFYARTSMSFRGVCIVLRWSEGFCWNSPWGISTVHPCFSLENMLQVYTNGSRNGGF